jgi:hypothetical protein
MSVQSNERILRRYLLADLDEVERENIEERLFSDEGQVAELVQAEADLIDDYALGVLSDRDRNLFEQNFILSDERHQNLLFARAMDAYLEEIDSPVETQNEPWYKRFLSFQGRHKRWTMVATMAAAGIVLVITVPVVLKLFAPKDQFSSLSQREQMDRRLAKLNRQTLSSQVLPGIELSLQPSNLLRDGGDFKRIEIAKDVKVLNLTFELPDAQHNKYIVIARKIEGNELFSVNDLSPQPNGVLLKIPAEFLPTDDYQFEVKGIDATGKSASVAIYNLRVVNMASQP